MTKENKTSIVTFRLKNSFLSHMKEMTHYLSLKRGEYLTYSQLIREALYKVYPLEGNEDD